MNLNLVNVTVFAVGSVLVYAAVKGVKPQDVVKSALGTPLPASPGSSGSSGGINSAPGGMGLQSVPPHMAVDPAPSQYRQPMPLHPVVSV